MYDNDPCDEWLMYELVHYIVNPAIQLFQRAIIEFPRHATVHLMKADHSLELPIMCASGEAIVPRFTRDHHRRRFPLPR